jgi:hypothetical protein
VASLTGAFFALEGAMLEEVGPLLTRGVTQGEIPSEQRENEATALLSLIINWAACLFVCVLFFGGAAVIWAMSCALSELCDSAGWWPCAIVQVTGMWGTVGFVVYAIGYAVWETVRETREFLK